MKNYFNSINLFCILILSIMIGFTSCYQQPYQPPVVVQTSGGQQPIQTGTDANGNPTYEVLNQGGQQVVYVNDGSNQFFMDYVLFNSLFNSGGWGSVYGRYNSNPYSYYNPGLIHNYYGWHHSGYYGYSGGHYVSVSNYNNGWNSYRSHSYTPARAYNYNASRARQIQTQKNFSGINNRPGAVQSQRQSTGWGKRTITSTPSSSSRSSGWGSRSSSSSSSSSRSSSFGKRH